MRTSPSPSISTSGGSRRSRSNRSVAGCSSPSSLSSSSSESDSSSSSSSTSSFSPSIRKGRISKAARERFERRQTMAKLQKMVPNAKEGDSQLQLLNHIMNYIASLQRQLEEDGIDGEESQSTRVFDIADLSRMFAQFSASGNAGGTLPVRSARPPLLSH